MAESAPAPKGPDLVWVKNPDGKAVRIDRADLQEAGNQGYTTIGKVEANEAQRRVDMSGVGGGAAALAGGLGSALSLGYTDVMAKQAGLAPDLAAAEAEHPIAHGVGELAGYLAPVVGEFGATRALGDVAKGVVQKGLLHEGQGLVSRAAIRAAAGAAESVPYATQQLVSESALGEPSLTAEHIVSTVAMNALGFGAFSGGASVLGDVAKPVFQTLEGGVKKLRDTFTRYYSKLGPEGADVALAERNMVQGPLQGPTAPVPMSKPDKGALTREMTDALQDTRKGLKQAQAEFAPIRAQTRETLLQDVPIERAQEEAGKVISEAGQKIEALRAQSDIFSKSVIDGAAQKLDAVAGRLSEAKTSHQVYEELDTLRGHLADASKAGQGVAASPSIASAQQELKGVFSDVRDSLQNRQVWGEAAAAQAEHNAAFSQVRRAEDNILKAMGEGPKGAREFSDSRAAAWLSKADGPEARRRWRLFEEYQQAVSGYNDMAQSWAGKLNQDASAFDGEALETLLSRNQEAAEKFRGFGEQSRAFKAAEQAGKADDAFRAAQAAQAGERAAGGSLLGLGAVHALATGHTGIGAAIIGAKGVMKLAHGLMTEPQKVAAVLSKLEGLGQAITRREDAIVKAIGKGSEAAGSALSKAGGVIKEAHDEDTLRDQADKIREMAGSPDAMIHRSGQLFGGLTNYAPATTAAAGVAMAQKVQYLAQHAPATSISSPMGPVKVKVPGITATKYAARVQIANDPVAVLGHVANGTLTREHMETMRALYPGMLARQQAKVLDSVTKLGPVGVMKLKPNQRASLSAFLGMPLTNAYTPQGTMSYQGVYAKIASQPVAPKMPSARVMNSPNAFLTRQQRIVMGKSPK